MILKDIVIIGTSGCAREIAFLLEENNKMVKEWNILGFIGNETRDLPYPVLGDDEWLLKQRKSYYAVCAVGDPTLKMKIMKKYEKNNCLKFPVIISRHALVGTRNNLGRGSVICSGVTITDDVTLGEFVTVNIGATVCHQADIGDFTTISPGVNVSGNVTIGKKCSIGVGAKVIQNIQIGNEVTVGAGGVVIRNIPSGATAVGCPTRII